MSSRIRKKSVRDTNLKLYKATANPGSHGDERARSRNETRMMMLFLSSVRFCERDFVSLSTECTQKFFFFEE